MINVKRFKKYNKIFKLFLLNNLEKKQKNDRRRMFNFLGTVLVLLLF